jgi:cell division protein FtsB
MPASPRPKPHARTTAIRWDRVGRFALLGVLVVILGLYISPVKHWLEQSRTADEQRAELRQLERDNARLEARARELRRPDALEREARKLGMIKQGERAYAIENAPRP